MRDADLVLTGADVYTVDAARRWARAVAVRGDRIVAVGTDDEVRDLIGPSTELRHLPGRMVVPGFQDAHIHAAFGGPEPPQPEPRRSGLDGRVPRARSPRTRRSTRTCRGSTGGGWYNAVFAAGGWPRREDLDAVVPDRPVFLMNTDVHGAWVNSRALEARRRSPPPRPTRGTATIVRDADGSPTGMLHEGAAYAFAAGRGAAHRRRHLAGVDPARAARSCTRSGSPDGRTRGSSRSCWRAYRALDDEGELTARVVTSLWWDRHRGLEQIDELRRRSASGARRQRRRPHREDHARRLSRERHRGVARAVRRRLRRRPRRRHPVRRRGACCARP